MSTLLGRCKMVARLRGKHKFSRVAATQIARRAVT